jgi:23S rRNA pseudouridine2605 synthase
MTNSQVGFSHPSRRTGHRSWPSRERRCRGRATGTPGSSGARARAAGGGQGYRGSPTGNKGAGSNTPGGEWSHGSGKGSSGGCASTRPGETRGAEGSSEVQKSDFSEEGRKAGTNNYCVSAERRRRDGGCRSEAKEERKTKKSPWHGSTGSAQGECSGSR